MMGARTYDITARNIFDVGSFPPSSLFSALFSPLLEYTNTLFLPSLQNLANNMRHDWNFPHGAEKAKHHLGYRSLWITSVRVCCTFGLSMLAPSLWFLFLFSLPTYSFLWFSTNSSSPSLELISFLSATKRISHISPQLWSNEEVHSLRLWPVRQVSRKCEGRIRQDSPN